MIGGAEGGQCNGGAEAAAAAAAERLEGRRRGSGRAVVPPGGRRRRQTRNRRRPHAPLTRCTAPSYSAAKTHMLPVTCTAASVPHPSGKGDSCCRLAICRYKAAAPGRATTTTASSLSSPLPSCPADSFSCPAGAGQVAGGGDGGRHVAPAGGTAGMAGAGTKSGARRRQPLSASWHLPSCPAAVSGMASRRRDTQWVPRRVHCAPAVPEKVCKTGTWVRAGAGAAWAQAAASRSSQAAACRGPVPAIGPAPQQACAAPATAALGGRRGERRVPAPGGRWRRSRS